MYNSDTELIFPTRIIPTLRNLRGDTWQSIVDRASDLSCTTVDHMAFVLLMVRLAHCDTCQVDSYRALHGCTLCAQRTIERFPGSDEDLSVLYEKAWEEIQQYTETARLT